MLHSRYDNSINHLRLQGILDHGFSSYFHTNRDKFEDLLKMNFFEEKSHGEIAEITKIPLGTVKSRIRLALEKIRGKLEQDGSMANLISDNESMVN